MPSPSARRSSRRALRRGSRVSERNAKRCSRRKGCRRNRGHITHEVLGARIEAALGGLGKVIAVHLPDRPHADEATAGAAMRAGAKAGSYIAVGAGTINDLVKFAAARQGKSCAVFATAPSMNGYTSTNAAITVDGHKKSLSAVAPLGVFVDLEVMARA